MKVLKKLLDLEIQTQKKYKTQKQRLKGVLIFKGVQFWLIFRCRLASLLNNKLLQFSVVLLQLQLVFRAPSSGGLRLCCFW